MNGEHTQDEGSKREIVACLDDTEKGSQIVSVSSDAEAHYGGEPEMIYVLTGSLALAGLAFGLLMAFAD
jgi:hypothetical protein